MSSDAYFETRLAPNVARTQVWRHVTQYLGKYVAADGDLLDLAAGYADFAGFATARRKVAMDITPDLAALVPAGVEPVVGDCTDLSQFADNEFATVLASNFFEHLTWDQLPDTLEQVRRVLRPDGRLLVIQPNFRLSPSRYFDDYTHRTIFTDTSLVDFLTVSGYSIERLEARFLPLSLKSNLSFGHRLVPLYLRLPFRPLAGQMLVVASPRKQA